MAALPVEGVAVSRSCPVALSVYLMTAPQLRMFCVTQWKFVS